jgi:hypothetical protein
MHFSISAFIVQDSAGYRISEFFISFHPDLPWMSVLYNTLEDDVCQYSLGTGDVAKRFVFPLPCVCEETIVVAGTNSLTRTSDMCDVSSAAAQFESIDAFINLSIHCPRS